MEKNSEIFLNIVKENNCYKKCVFTSFQELESWKSLIFKRGQYWYQYDNWNLPNTGIVKEWEVDSNDWIPKVESFESDSSTQFNLVLDIEKCLIPDNYVLQDVRFSPVVNYIVLVVSCLNSTDLIGVKKYSMERMFRIENVSTESSFYLGKYGILFTRLDSFGRPNKLFYKMLDTSEEKLLFEEIEQSFRIRVMHGDEDSCLVKSSDFHKGHIFVYIFRDSGFERYSFSHDICIIPRDITVFHWRGKTYFLTISSNSDGEDIIYLKDVISGIDRIIYIPYCERTRQVYWISGKIILDCSDESKSIFYYFDYIEEAVKENDFNRIVFDKKTVIYENSYFNQKLLFVERGTFSDKILSYSFSTKILKEEIEVPVFKDFHRYQNTVIWTKGDKNRMSVPISLFWKGEDFSKLPINRKCILNVYGAYGRNDNTKLDKIMLSIINAGFLYAIVHVRGGGYLGGDWYRQGKGLNKWNSINDFIESVHYLIDSNIIDKEKVGLITSSAGGVIAGSVLNEENNLLKSMLLFSPFVNPYDALQNFNDPLSKTEVSEWGDISNPKIKKYIKSYSPMQNIAKARGSGTLVINILGAKDIYINNKDVLEWSNKQTSIGFPKSIVLPL